MKKYRLRTNNPKEIRRSLNRIMNMLLNDEIDPKVATAIIKGCNSVLMAIKTDEQQKKIEELEIFMKDTKECMKNQKK